MKRTVLLISLLISAINGTSQDYLSVHADKTSLFQYADNRVIGLRVDSVATGSDIELYPFACILEFYGCFPDDISSWIGKKVVVKPDGSNLFFNKLGDTISLKTQAGIYESWIAYQRADTFFVEATVQSVALEEFLDLQDSVKTIAFRVTDQQGSTLDHSLNNLEVKISKSYGFIETLNFYHFPDLISYIDVIQNLRYTESLTLVGISNPRSGIQNLKWFDVYDFNPGDELHIQEYRIENEWFSSDNRCIYRYLDRNDYADSLVYRYAREQSIRTTYRDSVSLIILNDTTQRVIYANPDFDLLPGVPVINDYSMYAMYMLSDSNLVKVEPDDDRHLFIFDSCWSLPTYEGCLYEKNYIEGLGGPYYSCSTYEGGFLELRQRRLAYYKKGDIEWGEKLDLTTIPERITDQRLQVYPNPADDVVIFKMDSNIENLSDYNMQIYNSSGRLVYTESGIVNGNIRVDVNGLKPGMYLYRLIYVNTGFKSSGKFVVE